MELLFAGILLLLHGGIVVAAPEPCPSDPSIEGYTDLKAFNQDNSADSIDQTYILCPNTTFEQACGDDSDLFISQSGTTVQCGADGSSKNQCNFQRANGTEESCAWVMMTEGLIAIKLQGLTFQGVEGETPLSLGIISMRQNEVTLEDCHWKGLHLDRGALLDPIGGNLTLSGCSFSNNVGDSLLFHQEGESLRVEDTWARCNEVSGQLMHTNNVNGVAAYESSCFMDNYYSIATIRAMFRDTVELNAAAVFESGSQKHLDDGVGISCLGVQQDKVGGVEVTCSNFTATFCSLSVDSTGPCPPRRLTPSPTAAPTIASSAGATGLIRSSALLVLALWAM